MKCENNLEVCPQPCGDYVCDKRIFGAGKCVDKATFCPKLIISTNCSLKNGDADCRDGTQGCDNYFCWPDNKVIKTIGTCRLGPPSTTLSPTTPPPTTEPPSSLPPCSQWGGWNGTKYVPISPEDISKYKDKDGKFRSGNNITCLSVGTAIGEISTEPQGFVKRIFSLVLGIAGGIALILIMISGYRIMASQGNPEALASGRQQLVGAIVGLLFIIFSFVILEVIGVDILKIPGFSP